MNSIKNYLFFMLGGFTLIGDVSAQNLMSLKDSPNKVSNLTLTNRTGRALTVSGLFISSWDVGRDSNCSICSGNIGWWDNVAGAVVSRVTIQDQQTLPIGENYLYNMIYNGLYYVKTNIPAPCSLPGCSWPGDDVNLGGWCISINALSLDADYTYSNFTNGSHPASAVPGYGASGNSPYYEYQYDLINPFSVGVGNACLGPVICDDETLTCRVSTPQDEAFEAY